MKATINRNKGISLIVLVITIIIMIILATAAILSLSSSNIVDKATLAKYKSDLSNLQEIIVAKVAERQLSNQDTSGRYVLSDWNIENSEYEDKVIIDNAKIVLRVTDNEGLIAAADELGISTASNSETSTLANTRGLNLLNYRIYGNSVQDGTPTPESPVEVLSLGENSINLLDADTILVSNGFVKQDDGSFYIAHSGMSNKKILFQNNSNNDIVTISFDYKNIYSSDYPGVVPQFWYTDGTYTTATITSSLEYRHVVFTSNINKVVESLRWTYGTGGNSTWIKNLQIERGSVATEYRPYKYIDAVSSGKNLIDTSNKTQVSGYSYLGSSESLTIATDPYETTYYIPCKQNTTYTISKKNQSYRLRTAFTEYLPAIGVATYNVTATAGVLSKSTTSPANGNYLVFSGPCKAPFEILTEEEFWEEFQIEEGLVQTSYEPYQTPITTRMDLTGHDPLRKIGDAADYIDYENRKIVRNVGKIVLDGSSDESWEYIGTQKVIWYKNSLITNSYKSSRIICNKLNNYTYDEAVSDFNKLGCYPTCSSFTPKTGIGGIAVRYTGITNLATGLKFLSDNPLTIYYVLQTQTEESF